MQAHNACETATPPRPSLPPFSTLPPHTPLNTAHRSGSTCCWPCLPHTPQICIPIFPPTPLLICNSPVRVARAVGLVAHVPGGHLDAVGNVVAGAQLLEAVGVAACGEESVRRRHEVRDAGEEGERGGSARQVTRGARRPGWLCSAAAAGALACNTAQMRPKQGSRAASACLMPHPVRAATPPANTRAHRR